MQWLIQFYLTVDENRKNFKTIGASERMSTVTSMYVSCLTEPTKGCFVHSNILTSTVPLAVRMLHYK